jgi:DNA repair photolyase
MRPIKAKSIISAGNGVNLYRGCTHGCIYCDSRSHCYHVDSFDDPGFKANALEIMRLELSRRRKKAMITTGAMSDPYVHAEADLQLTRGMLGLLKEFGFGVGILTKSDLALRDIDLIAEVHSRYASAVCYTITTADEELCRKIEPGVCTTARRFECLHAFAARGVTTGVWMVPILPFINDQEENVRTIVRRCGEAGVKYLVVYDFGTTMRDGSRDYFYAQLDRLFPGMKQRYIRQFGSAYICPSPNSQRLRAVFEEECRKQGILYKPSEIRSLVQADKSPRQLKLF